MYFKRVLGYFGNYFAKKWPPPPWTLPQSSRRVTGARLPTVSAPEIMGLPKPQGETNEEVS